MQFNIMTDFLNYLTNDYGVPSVDCCVHRQGREIYRYATGSSYNKIKDLYYMYSVSKPITCVAALQLLEQGKYLLNDPLWEYLPEYKNMYVKCNYEGNEEGIKTAEGKIVKTFSEEINVKPAETSILIKHLFTMCAGFNYNRETEAIKRYCHKTEGKLPTRLIAKALSEQPLDFEPGTRWQYSLCHDVLGAFVEVVSGKRLGEYIKENIFEPLGMKDSSFEIGSDKKSRLASQFLFDDEKGCAVPIENKCEFTLGTEYESGGAGIVSSVDNYILFADMLANGGKSKSGEQVLGEHTISFMKTNQLSENILRDMNWPQLKGYGYGMGVRTLIDRASAGSLSPLGEFGWGGAAGSYLMVDTDNNIALFYAQHMKNNKEPYIHPRLRNILYALI